MRSLLSSSVFMSSSQMTVEIALVAGIEIYPVVDRLMADAHPFIIRIVHLQSTGYCLRRPVELELCRHICTQSLMPLAVVSGLVKSPLHEILGSIVPADCIIGVGRSIPLYLTTYAGMVSPETATNLP